MCLKLFLLLISTITVTVAADKQISVKVTPQQVLDLRDISKKCAEEAGVDHGILSKFIDWTLDDDVPSKVYTYCVAINYGYVDKDGKINIPAFLQHELLKGTKEEFIEIIRECDQLRGESLKDTIFEKGNCLNKLIETVVIRPSS